NTHDFYAMGFVANDGTLWEFRLETDVARLRGSRAVGIKLNYPPLVGLTVSKETLKNAFSDLARMVQVYLVKNWAKLTRLAMECEEEDIVLTDAVKGVVVDRDYSFFCQSGNEQRISQARIAKLLIKVRTLYNNRDTDSVENLLSRRRWSGKGRMRGRVCDCDTRHSCSATHRELINYVEYCVTVLRTLE
ncbi:hypothetical protein Tco_1267001, partial [Tanacetum coccineum]